MGDIFREVEEELRQERHERLWRRYGKHLVGGAVLLVVAVAGWQVWTGHRLAESEADGLAYSAAAELARDGRTGEAEAAFAALGERAGDGYRLLALLRRAGLRAEAGDHAAAIDLYDRLAGDDGAPPALRGFATVMTGFQALRVPDVSAGTIVARIAPMTAAGEAYRHVARELLALVAQREGDRETAVSHYEKLVDDAETPTGIRARAAEMLEVLGDS